MVQLKHKFPSIRISGIPNKLCIVGGSLLLAQLIKQTWLANQLRQDVLLGGSVKRWLALRKATSIGRITGLGLLLAVCVSGLTGYLVWVIFPKSWNHRLDVLLLGQPRKPFQVALGGVASKVWTHAPLFDTRPEHGAATALWWLPILLCCSCKPCTGSWRASFPYTSKASCAFD